MPNWKKVIISGSDATLNSLDVSTNITASGNISSSNEVSAKFLELPFSSDAGGASLYFNDGTFAPNDDVPYIRGERQSGTVGYLSLGYNDSDMLTVGKNSNGNSVDIPGSLKVGAELTASRATVNGSGSTLFDVIGSTGTLFSIDDDLTGTLFTANDVSGLPVLEASASGDVFIGKTPQSLYTTATISSTIGSTTTESICSLSTSSYDGAFFEYTAREVGNTNSRAGSIMAVWNNGNISFTDTATRDIGNTSLLTVKPIISGSTARLVVYGDGGFKVKTIIRAI